MLARMRKFIAAIVMVGGAILTKKFGVDLGLDAALADAIAGGLILLLPPAIYAIPNAPAPAATPTDLRKAAALLFVLLLPLGACVGLPDDASPREKALALMSRYEAVQAAAEIAVTSPLLADRPAVKNGIKAATRVATTAVLAYDQAARGCLRQPDGSIGVVPGLRCDPEAARLIYPTATSALAQVAGELVRHGFIKE